MPGAAAPPPDPGGTDAPDAGDEPRPGAFALVGPGRAGTSVALALVERGWRAVAVAGRSPTAASTVTAAAVLDAPATLAGDAGRGADLVVIATPDAAIEAVAGTVAPGLEPGALVVHLAGSRGLDALRALADSRPDVHVGALHPLQSLPSAAVGLDRLAGSWAAVAGPPSVGGLARSLGLRPIPVPDEQRARYHATAVVASNHLVALLGQVERLADACGVPLAAFAPLARASLEGALTLGPRAALTGPVARGDLGTVARHLESIDPVERDAYRALAQQAARLAGTRAGGLDRLLAELRDGPVPPAR